MARAWPRQPAVLTLGDTTRTGASTGSKHPSRTWPGDQRIVLADRLERSRLMGVVETGGSRTHPTVQSWSEKPWLPGDATTRYGATQEAATSGKPRLHLGGTHADEHTHTGAVERGAQSRVAEERGGWRGWWWGQRRELLSGRVCEGPRRWCSPSLGQGFPHSTRRCLLTRCAVPAVRPRSGRPTRRRRPSAEP